MPENIAISKLQDLVDANDGKAMITMAILLKNGVIFDQDDEKAFELIQKSAEACDTDALLILSMMYSIGYHVEADQEKAMEYLSKSADLDNEEAMHFLAYELLIQSDPPDFDTFILWLDRAAKRGHSLSANDLGLYWKEKQDFAKAREYFELACQYNNPYGCYNLGVLYYNGDGVEQDYAKAKRYFQKSAERQFGPAYTGLAILAFYGLTGKTNTKKAIGLFEKGAARYDGFACHLLSRMYAVGDGLNVDLQQSEHFALLADKYGMYASQKSLDRLPEIDLTRAKKHLLNVYFTIPPYIYNLATKNR